MPGQRPRGTDGRGPPPQSEHRRKSISSLRSIRFAAWSLAAPFAGVQGGLRPPCSAVSPASSHACLRGSVLGRASIPVQFRCPALTPPPWALLLHVLLRCYGTVPARSDTHALYMTHTRRVACASLKFMTSCGGCGEMNGHGVREDDSRRDNRTVMREECPGKGRGP